MIKIKRKLSRKEWNLLVVCIIIVVGLFSDIVLRRTYINFSRLGQEVNSTEKELAALTKILRQEEAVQKDYKNVMAGLRQIEASDDFLQQIESIAKSVNLNIGNINPAPVKDYRLYKLYSVNIKARDDIPALTKFLHTVAEDFKGIGIQTLRINAQSTKEPPMMSLLISAVAFKE